MSTNPLIPSNIFLVGPMGVGKTTIGKQLSEKLHLTFRDSDQEVEEATGASIPLIFEVEGEAGFRKRECGAVAKLTREHNVVLATGGGAVLNEENRQCLKQNGYVIYLHASVDDLLERTAFCTHRPLLKTENPRERLEQILATRESLYKEVADAVIRTGRRSKQEVLRRVLRCLSSQNSYYRKVFANV